MTIGIKNKADITGKILDGRFVFTYKDEIFSIKPKTPTIHFLYDSLIAAAIGMEYGIKLIDSIETIESFEPVKGRGRVVVSPKGVNIIDETYNANPVSMRETLKALEQKEGRRFAVLADMLELGKNTKEIHENLGLFISDLRLDGVFCFGELSKNITDKCPLATHFDSIEELTSVLNQKLKIGDWVLVKGSNSMNMIRVVESIN
ncbi:MAG: cyanophycin synthetase [Caldisericia bacterium]